MSAYITGSSLVCNLGNSKKEIVSKIKTLSQENYSLHVKEVLKKNGFYNIESFDGKDRFYKIIKYVVEEALKEANITKEQKEEIVVFIGSTSMKISVDEQGLKELSNTIIGTFIEELVGTKKDSFILSTACTSSTNALIYASNMIEKKLIKRALVVGIEVLNQTTCKGFDSLMLLSKEGIYRPFDKRSDGIILGEACSAVVLESSGTKDDYKILGGCNVCDNYSETSSIPSGKPIFDALSGALKSSDITLKEVDFIKAHAAGSQNNNESEANGLNLLFKKEGFIPSITTIKPYLGHTLGACGINEIVLVLSSLQEGFMPSTLGFEEPTEELIFTPLLIHKKIDKKATILFNFVAFGGNNSSIVLSNR